MRSTCSRTTTPSSTSRDHKVSRSYCTYLFSLFLILAQFSVRENLLVVAGTPETKELKDMMPDILKQVGPKQYQFLKQQMGNIDTKQDGQDDDDDVPELVGTFEDAGK